LSLLKNITFSHSIFFAFFLICKSVSSQELYFQQEVNYKISVKLNDEAHTLSAFEEIEYINNSENELTYLYFHLWPNAYKTNQTSLAKQLLRLGKSALHFSTPEERGFIDSLNFKANGSPLKMEYDEDEIDICKLTLNAPLKPHDTLKISTPFFVKIPDAKFSRLGHTGQAYFITQWFPKPAVYDKDGWHPMPYLDQGEFYSEFGSFEVNITLPKNYVLAATGDRINAIEEENFLNENVGRTIQRLDLGDYKEYDMGFPASSKEFKTITFRQFRVHDFAWCADKRFNVLHDQLELPNTKRIIDTWAFFTNKNFNLWKYAISYINESTYFYSYLLGDYPYNNVNAVDGTIMAGGGMEYPNITVIGDAQSAFDLDVTITHEVGHNWFYGILANNERDFPWMDEGLNSFYEMRYVRAKYPFRKLSEYLGRDSTFKILGAGKIPYWKEKETAYYLTARARQDQPINTASDDLTSFNYGCITYEKSAVAFDYLMSYMGEDNFDKAMRFYFEKFKFQHAYVSNLQKTLSHFNGTELDWFFDHIINSTDKIDYKMKRIKQLPDGSFDLKIKNKTGVIVPFNIYAYKKGKPAGVVWSNGFYGARNVGFPAVDADKFVIDGMRSIPEINRSNNYIRARGIFKRAKAPALNFLTGLENPSKRQMYFFPLVGANFYNGAMAGLVLHNYGFLQKKFEYSLFPMYSMNTKSAVGFAEAQGHFYPGNVFREINVGARAKSFAYDIYNTKYLNEASGTSFKDLYLNYYTFSPFIQFELKKKKATSPVTQYITYQNNNIFTEVADIDTSTFRTFKDTGPKKKMENYWVNSLNYDLQNKRFLNPYSLNVNLQHNDKMAKVSAEFNYGVTFSKKHELSIRAFAGAFVMGSSIDRGRYAFRSSGYNGYHDYTFGDNFIARNEYQGVGFSQFSERDGAMKVWTPLGQSTEWIAAVNIKSPRVFILPIRVFLDVATTDPRFLNNDKILWCGGVNIMLWKDIIDIYIPAAYSTDIKTVLDLNQVSFWNRIRFTLNLHKLEPRNLIKNSLF
jgi:hypothetical protein